ncbi:MAG TPA: 2-oxoglutarate and iron-dependent oxygenase domain-containing protein [Acidimicrobiales bacterium]|nr:2-oxoglutarate and iron-dependent oxygenase domain-containing protein [Acidimicrobiales bacterium]
MSDQILDVDLLAFERGDQTQRAAVVDGVMRSLATGFVYTSHDVGESLLDDAYGMLAEFFALDQPTKDRSVAPGTHGQTGYTGLLVETAATADVADWKEMLNWGRAVPAHHPLRGRYPHRYHEPVLPDADVPGIAEVLLHLHDRLFDLQRRFLRIVAVGLGCHESFFDLLLEDGPTLSRAIHYPAMAEAPAAGHVWAAEHADINLITALPRATERGLQVKTDGGWVDAVPPPEHAIINTGIMLERISNGRIPSGRHQVVATADQAGDRLSMVQFCHPTPWTILLPAAPTVDDDHPQRFGAIEAGDLLDQVLYEINLVEAARGERA